MAKSKVSLLPITELAMDDFAYTVLRQIYEHDQAQQCASALDSLRVFVVDEFKRKYPVYRSTYGTNLYMRVGKSRYVRVLPPVMEVIVTTDVFYERSGLVIKTNRCVSVVPCSYCNAQVDEPCKGSGRQAEYTNGTHYMRRETYRKVKRQVSLGLP